MTDTRAAERARIIGQHFPLVLDDGIHCADYCRPRPPTRAAWAEHVAQALTPAIEEQVTDTYLLAVGSCIAVIEATTVAAVAEESYLNARVIAEWAGKVVWAMRYAAAGIAPGGLR